MKPRALISCGATVFLVALAVSIQTFAQDVQQKNTAQSASTVQAKILDQYGKLPLSFELNQGQTDERVKFLSRGSDYDLFLTGDEALLSLRVGKTKQKAPVLLWDRAKRGMRTTLRMQVLGANPKASVSGVGELAGKSNYFVGDDPKEWRTNISNYTKVRYKSVYPGVDLLYYGNQQQLEWDFVVAPEANPDHIRLRFNGLGIPKIDKNGDLLLGPESEQVRMLKPRVYQERDGQRIEIAGKYVLGDKNEVRFAVTDYDLTKQLVIDPVLVYATYFNQSINAIAVDSLGNAYVTGLADNGEPYPLVTTPGAFQTTLGRSCGELAFVTKLNASGSALAYSTYLGGTNNYDAGLRIAVDSTGNAYLTGYTGDCYGLGDNFPTTPGAFQTAYGGVLDAFVTKLNATGSALIYSTFLGGSNYDAGDGGIAVDSEGDAYVTGETGSTTGPSVDFPVTPGAFQTVSGGYTTNCTEAIGTCGYIDAFVTKLNASGSALIYSTFLGGNENDFPQGIAVDSKGAAYVTGYTASHDFPTTSVSYQPTFGGGNWDAFVTKLNASGSALFYSTYLGGASDEVGLGIALDSSNRAYLTGYTQSNNFPTTSFAFQKTCDLCPNSEVAFVTKLNPSGSALDYSTYLGGSKGDVADGIAVDRLGDAYVTGGTNSTDFPITPGAFQKVCPACAYDMSNVFVTKLNTKGSALVYSTYLGGSQGDQAYGIALDNLGNAYVTGEALSTDFPTTSGSFQNSCGQVGACNGYSFIAKIAEPSYSELIYLVDQYESSALTAYVMTVTLKAAQDGASRGDARATNVLLKAFIDEVSAGESVSSLTSAEAATLIQQANGLMIPN